MIVKSSGRKHLEETLSGNRMTVNPAFGLMGVEGA